MKRRTKKKTRVHRCSISYETLFYYNSFRWVLIERLVFLSKTCAAGGTAIIPNGSDETNKKYPHYSLSLDFGWRTLILTSFRW